VTVGLIGVTPADLHIIKVWLYLYDLTGRSGTCIDLLCAVIAVKGEVQGMPMCGAGAFTASGIAATPKDLSLVRHVVQREAVLVQKEVSVCGVGCVKHIFSPRYFRAFFPHE
jgi:hypothetical protein